MRATPRPEAGTTVSDNKVDVTGRINKGIGLWLEEEKGYSDVTITSISDPEVEDAYGGCDTCGYGGRNGRAYFTIYFNTPTKTYDYVEVEGSSLDFLATVLPYIDRTN